MSETNQNQDVQLNDEAEKEIVLLEEELDKKLELYATKTLEEAREYRRGFLYSLQAAEVKVNSNPDETFKKEMITRVRNLYNKSLKAFFSLEAKFDTVIAEDEKEPVVEVSEGEKPKPPVSVDLVPEPLASEIPVAPVIHDSEQPAVIDPELEKMLESRDYSFEEYHRVYQLWENAERELAEVTAKKNGRGVLGKFFDKNFGGDKKTENKVSELVAKIELLRKSLEFVANLKVEFESADYHVGELVKEYKKNGDWNRFDSDWNSYQRGFREEVKHLWDIKLDEKLLNEAENKFVGVKERYGNIYEGLKATRGGIASTAEAVRETVSAAEVSDEELISTTNDIADMGAENKNNPDWERFNTAYRGLKERLAILRIKSENNGEGFPFKDVEKMEKTQKVIAGLSEYLDNLYKSVKVETEEKIDLLTRLTKAQDVLAELSATRKKGFLKNDDLEKRYVEAQKEYNNLKKEVAKEFNQEKELDKLGDFFQKCEIEFHKKLQEHSKQKENLASKGWRWLGEMNVYNLFKNKAEKDPNGWWAKEFKEWGRAGYVFGNMLSLRLLLTVGSAGIVANEVRGWDSTEFQYIRTGVVGVAGAFGSRSLMDMFGGKLNDISRRFYKDDEAEKSAKEKAKEESANKKLKTKVWDAIKLKWAFKENNFFESLDKRVKNDEEKLDLVEKIINDSRAYANVYQVDLFADPNYLELLKMQNELSLKYLLDHGNERQLNDDGFDKVMDLLNKVEAANLEASDKKISYVKKVRWVKRVGSVAIGAALGAFTFFRIGAKVAQELCDSEFIAAKKVADLAVMEHSVVVPPVVGVEEAPMVKPTNILPPIKPITEVPKSMLPPTSHPEVVPVKTGLAVPATETAPAPKYSLTDSNSEFVDFADKNGLTKPMLEYLQKLQDGYGLKVDQSFLDKLQEYSTIDNKHMGDVFDHLAKPGANGAIKVLAESRGFILKTLMDQNNVAGAIKFLQENCDETLGRGLNALGVDSLADSPKLRVLLEAFHNQNGSVAHKDASRAFYDFLKHVAFLETKGMPGINSGTIMDVNGKEIVGAGVKVGQHVDLPHAPIPKTVVDLDPAIKDHFVDQAVKQAVAKDAVSGQHLSNETGLFSRETAVAGKPAVAEIHHEDVHPGGAKVTDLPEYNTLESADSAMQMAGQIKEVAKGVNIGSDHAIHKTVEAVKAVKVAGEAGGSVGGYSSLEGRGGNGGGGGGGGKVPETAPVGPKVTPVISKEPAFSSKSSGGTVEKVRPTPVQTTGGAKVMPAEKTSGVGQPVDPEKIVQSVDNMEKAKEFVKNVWLEKIGKINFVGADSKIITDFFEEEFDKVVVGRDPVLKDLKGWSLINYFNQGITAGIKSPEYAFLLNVDPALDGDIVTTADYGAEASHWIKFNVGGKVYALFDRGYTFSKNEAGDLLRISANGEQEVVDMKYDNTLHRPVVVPRVSK